MNKSKLIIAILIFSALTFWFCQKKMFDTVEVHGRVVNYITKIPILTDISLMADDATTAKDVPQISLCKVGSESNGYFDIKTNASARGNYNLLIGEESYKYKISVNPKENSNTNLDDVLIGDYTFNCQVTLVPVSSSDIDFYRNGIGNSPDLHFNAGTSTQFTYTSKYSIQDYNTTGHYFWLWYKTYPGGVTSYSLATIPINSGNTLSITINY